MLDLAGFRALFPEFKTAPDPLVQSRLDQAALRVDTSVFGTRINEGHGLKAAHLLAISPYGQMARMSSKAGDSTYNVQYRELVTICAGLILRAI